MNSTDDSTRTTVNLVGKVADVAHEIVTLAELQSRLFFAELRQAERRVWPRLVLLIVGAVLGLSCIPLALVTFALILVDVAHLSYASAFACTLLLSLIVAGGMIGLAVRRFRSQAGFFACSRAEWTLNVEWLKEQLLGLRDPLEM